MSIRNLWFYRFYSYKDLIVGIIMLVALHVLLFPFFLWTFELMVACHSYTFFVLTFGISLINIGMFIRAVVLFIIDVKRGMLEKANLHTSNENVMM